MSLIHGPSTPLGPASTAALKQALGEAKSMLGTTALREMEKLIGVRFDPAPAYLFYVTVSGLIVGLFTGCEGVRVRRDVEELREGGLNDHVHHLPGQISTGTITLKRGLSASRELWNWFTDGQYTGKVESVSMSIVQGAPGMSALSVVGMEGPGIIKTWDVEGAFPIGWSMSNLDVNDTEHVVIESVEIACRTISLSKIVGTPMSPTALF